MNSNKDVSYFPGLNSIRFLAAVPVIMSHVELIKWGMRVKHNFELFDRLNFGGIGVYLFFVLSGFLITYLLLKEKHKTNTIALKKYYLRRIFRIWPLYYMIVILGFFVLPHIHIIDLPYYKYHLDINYTWDLILYLLILPHVAFSIFPAVQHIGQSWSIGVEEQFYIVWPILLKKLSNVKRLIIVSFIVICVAKGIVLFIFMKYPQVHWLLYLKNFVAMCKFESIMIGAYGAYLFFYNRTKILNVIYNQTVFYVSLLISPFLSYFVYQGMLQNGIHIVISIFIIIFLLNIATNPKCKVKFNNKILDYLGQITFGIYMYHLMIIPFLVYFFKHYFNFDGSSVTLNIMLHLLSILFSVVVAILSYEFLEKYFLKIKRKYEVRT